jgi:hypothetical protein
VPLHQVAPSWVVLPLNSRNIFSMEMNSQQCRYVRCSNFIMDFQCFDVKFKSCMCILSYSYLCKVKQCRYTPWRLLGERRYSSHSFTTSALDGGEWSVLRLGHTLPPGKGPLLPIGQESGWAPELVCAHRLEELSFAPAGDRTSITRSSSP